MVTGAVWLGQGLGLINGSFMSGSTFWAVVGAVCVVAGLGLLGWPWRQPTSSRESGREDGLIEVGDPEQFVEDDAQAVLGEHE